MHHCITELPTEILNLINEFNYVCEQKILKCVSCKFSNIKTREYIEELKKYSKNYSELNIAHKSNSLYYSISDTKDEYNNSHAELKNIWWFGVSSEFIVKKDKYLIIFDMELPILSKDYQIKITFKNPNDMSVNHPPIKTSAKNFKNIFFLLDVKLDTLLNIELDEHDTYKKKIIVKKIICIPYHIVQYFSSHFIIESDFSKKNTVHKNYIDIYSKNLNSGSFIPNYFISTNKYFNKTFQLSNENKIFYVVCLI
jgi:hypothetical protein